MLFEALKCKKAEAQINHVKTNDGNLLVSTEEKETQLIQ